MVTHLKFRCFLHGCPFGGLRRRRAGGSDQKIGRQNDLAVITLFLPMQASQKEFSSAVPHLITGLAHGGEKWIDNQGIGQIVIGDNRNIIGDLKASFLDSAYSTNSDEVISRE